MKRSSLLLLVCTIVFFPRASHAEAPNVSLLGPVSVLRADEVVPVDVVITSAGKTMNAANLTISYPSALLSVERIQREETVFDLWPEEPSWDHQQGKIHLVGGHPNGLVMINARVATIYFRAKQPGTVALQIDAANSGLYLNDGAGTKIDVNAATLTLTLHDSLYPGIPLTSSTHASPETWSTVPRVVVGWTVEPQTDYSYTFSLDARTIPDDVPEKTVGEVSFDQLVDGRYYFAIRQRVHGGAWSEVTQRRFLIDTTAPQAFQIVHPDPATVGGRSLITWVSQDLMSGVDHANLNVGGRAMGLVTSPLQLKSAWQGKTISITVADQAGNQQTANWQNTLSNTPWSWGWVALLLILIVTAPLLMFLKLRRRS